VDATLLTRSWSNKKTIMKPAKLLLPLFIIVAAAACDKSVPVREGAVPLGGCITKALPKGQIKICYDSLVNDSRCPANATCVWQGAAIGKFSFYVNSSKHTLTLSTFKFGPYNRDTVVGNYKIELLDIDPYPGAKPRRPAAAVVTITAL
jgi:hypothetical protein